MKENIKAPRHWPLCGEFTGEFPAQRVSNTENDDAIVDIMGSYRLEFRIIESYHHAIVTLKYEMFTDAFLRQSAKVS